MSTITKNFTKVWLQERSLIFVTNTNGAQYVDLYNGDTKLARYNFDNGGKVTIDVTDYLRAYPSTASLKVVVQGESALTISTEVAGRINPDHLLLPPRPKIEGWTIAPPCKMLQDIGTPIIFEAYGFTPDGDCEFKTDLEQVPNEIGRTNTVQVGAKTIEVAEAHDVLATIALQPLTCGTKYAAVEWVSASGITRRHTFEYKGVNSAVSASISLQTMDGSFDVRKGRRDGFTLSLGGLNAYDMSYYSDVLLSSCVRVSFDGREWHKVDVTSKSITIQDGDAEFQKLEIAVNYKEYDAL